MRSWLTPWFDAFRFAAEAQGVVAMRLMRIAAGGPKAAKEAHRMISEKLEAFALAEIAAADAIVHGSSLDVAAARAFAPLRRRVHANSRRLVRARH
jgi:hypothetical protein